MISQELLSIIGDVGAVAVLEAVAQHFFNVGAVDDAGRVLRLISSLQSV